MSKESSLNEMTKCFVKERWDIMGEDLSEDEGFEDEEDLILGEEDMRRQ